MSYLLPRKRRFEESEWDGTKEEVIQKVMKCEQVDEVREKMALIKCIRKDISEDDLLCLELHMKLRYAKDAEADIFLSETKKEHKKFLRHLLHYMTEEFLRQGLDGVREFRNMIIGYEWDERINIFTIAIKERPEITCELWVTLLALVTDAILRPLTKEEAVPLVALQVRILECLQNGSTPCRGMHNLGISILKSQFAELKPNQILLACDAIIHSGFNECNKSLEDDSPENRKLCESNAHTFINYSYRFFNQVMIKLGASVFPPTTSSRTLVKTVTSILSANWTPPHRPAVSYLLAVLKLRLPMWKSDSFLVPVGSSLVTPIYCSNNPKYKVHVDEGHFNDVLANLCEFCDKFLPLSKEVDSTLEVIGRTEFFRWVALAYYMTSKYDKAISMCSEKWKETTDAQYLVIMLACHQETGHTDLVMQTFVELLNCVEANSYYVPSKSLYTLHGTRGQKSLMSVPTTSLGHWLCHSAQTILKSHPKSTSTLEDNVTGMQMIFSQFNFSDTGHLVLQAVDDSIRNKKSFNCEKIAEYLVLKQLLERLVVLSNMAELNLGENWDHMKKYKEAAPTSDDADVLKKTVQFLLKFESEIIAN